jgi:hypothetical protein
MLAIEVNSPIETVAIDSNVEKPASTNFAAVEGPIPGKSVIVVGLELFVGLVFEFVLFFSDFIFGAIIKPALKDETFVGF